MGYSYTNKCKICSPPTWQNLNCNSLKFTSDDLSVSINKTADCTFDFSVGEINPPPISTADTDSINLSGDGSTIFLSADVNVSLDAGNIIEIHSDGMYVPAFVETPNTVTDSSSIDFSISGILGRNISGSVILSPDVGNVIQSLGNGLFVPTPPTPISYIFSTGLTEIANTVTSNLSTGISGGQAVIGGIAASETLTLSSTVNATKGKILFGTSAYDEVNNRLGVGTQSPTAGNTLQVVGREQVGSIYLDGETTTAWSTTSITSIGKFISIPNGEFKSMIEDLSNVTMLTGFRGYAGMYSTAYCYSPTPITPNATAYVAGYSSLPIYDNAGGSALFRMHGYFSILNGTATSPITSAHDYYAGELNSSNRVPPTANVVNHYGLFMEAFTKATNNYGVYVNGAQLNYFGGNVGIGQNSPTSKLHIVDSLTGSSAVSSVNVSTTWNTSGNPTAIFANITNAASGSTAKLVDIQEGAISRFLIDKSSCLLQVTTNGIRIVGASGGFGGISLSASAPSSEVISSGTKLHFALSNITALNTYAFSADIGSFTSGNAQFMYMTNGASGAEFDPSSGTATFVMQELNPGINQTGTASGITRGLLINPSLVSAVDFRAIEINNNSHWAIYQSGANAKSLFAGTLRFTGLPTYADEAAATTGGLITGDIYKTATGELRIKL